MSWRRSVSAKHLVSSKTRALASMGAGGIYSDDASSPGSSHAWLDVWKRAERGQPSRTPHSIDNRRKFTFRCAPHSLNLFGHVMPFWMGGSYAAESSPAAAVPTSDGSRVALGRHRIRHSSFRRDIFAGLSGAHQQPDREMDSGVASSGLANPRASLGYVSLVANLWVGCSIRCFWFSAWVFIKQKGHRLPHGRGSVRESVSLTKFFML